MTKDFAHYHWHPNYISEIAARVAHADDVNGALRVAVGYAGSFYQEKARMKSAGFVVDGHADANNPMIYMFRTERGDTMEIVLQNCKPKKLEAVMKKIL